MMIGNHSAAAAAIESSSGLLVEGGGDEYNNISNDDNNHLRGGRRGEDESYRHHRQLPSLNTCSQLGSGCGKDCALTCYECCVNEMGCTDVDKTDVCIAACKPAKDSNC